MTRVAILDCGISNVGSVQNAFGYIGVKSVLARRVKDITDCSHLVLPGDGSFPEGMARLKGTGLDESVYRAVESGKMVLGICLGMQLFADEGEEFGLTKGLGLMPGRVVRMATSEIDLPLPQVGWNDVSILPHSRLCKGLEERTAFYFMQSFVFSDPTAQIVSGICDYGGPCVSIVEKENILGAQFHPEKSQRAGLQLLKNFSEME
jgi:glutamine amidotransferase